MPSWPSPSPSRLAGAFTAAFPARLAADMAKSDVAARLLARFAGLDRAHGNFQVNGKRDGHKRLGHARTVKEPPTAARWAQHLAGRYGLGCYPLRDDGTASWGAIDVDTYPTDHAALERAITQHDLPLIVCESKSGGAWLLLFLKEPAPAAAVRATLMAWRKLLPGVPDDAEVFPKQDQLANPKKDFGNWLNMPYYGSERRAMRASKWLAKPEDFLAYAAKRAITPADLLSPNGRGTVSHEDTEEQSAAPPAAQGERNNRLTDRVGGLLANGMREEDALTVALRENATYQPPMSEHEVTDIVQGLYRRSPPSAKAGVLEKMNAQYAVITTGGRVGMLRQDLFDRDGMLEILGPNHFRLKLANRRFPDYKDKQGKLHRGKPLAEWWIGHPGRREYEEIVFDPTGTAAPSALNLWRGFAVAPDTRAHPERRCARFLAHVRDHICGGDGALYNKVIGWVAQMFQEPARKLDTALVLRGLQGSGKSIFGSTIGHLLGRRHYLPVAKGHLITGQFNGQLAAILLLQAEEAFWAADKQAEGVLKDLITRNTQSIELKGKEPFTVANYVRLLVTSNAAWVVPAGVDNRRFMVLDMTNPEHCNDRKYFRALTEELQHGGYEALLAYLLAFDWQAGAPDILPATAALAEQKEHSFTPPVAYLYALADRGWLFRDEGASGVVKHEHIWKDYAAWARATGHRHPGGHPQLTRALNLFLSQHGCPPLMTKRPKDGDKQRRQYEFPPLVTLRAAFARALGVEPEWSQSLPTVNAWWPCQHGYRDDGTLEPDWI